MSMDTGCLAQMTYNSAFNSGSSLGVSTSGFASRGKGSHIKPLSALPHRISTIDETQPMVNLSTPRTSRSHLLAGLRTAPKSASLPVAPAPRHQQLHFDQDGGRYAHRASERLPQTATGAGFPQQAHRMNATRLIYTQPEQVLAPPTIHIGGDSLIDEKLYAELMSTNLFLAAQQQHLQQQLISVTAAAQQFQNLHLGISIPQPQHTPTPNMSFYQQQLRQGVQPVVQPVPGQPGLFSVFNPLTGQQSFIVDNLASLERFPPSVHQAVDEEPALPAFRAEVSPPRDSVTSPSLAPSSNGWQRDFAPRSSPSPPQDVAQLPPPSAQAFRRGHRKSSPTVPAIESNIDTARANAGVKPKSVVLPPTPLTGTFGPGQGRAGEHPIRQPRGPPALEDLLSKPTSKHEGSKNFATRQRRRAVHSLVRAGIERRGESRSLGYHSSSGGTNTPASEKEFTFTDGDDVTVRSCGSLSSKPSLGSLRAVANGAIGSERKERSSRERNTLDSPFINSPTSEDVLFFGGKVADNRSDRTSPVSTPAAGTIIKPASQAPERRRTPMLVLSNAAKRKTPIM